MGTYIPYPFKVEVSGFDGSGVAACAGFCVHWFRGSRGFRVQSLGYKGLGFKGFLGLTYAMLPAAVTKGTTINQSNMPQTLFSKCDALDPGPKL